MMNDIYLNVMLAASGCMIITGIILAATKSPSDKRASKFRMAKHTLTVAVIILGVLNMLQIGIDPDGDINMLFISGFLYRQQWTRNPDLHKPAPYWQHQFYIPQHHQTEPAPRHHP